MPPTPGGRDGVRIALSQVPAYTPRGYRYRAGVLRGVPVCSPAFAGTHFAYPRGMARLS